MFPLFNWNETVTNSAIIKENLMLNIHMKYAQHASLWI